MLSSVKTAARDPDIRDASPPPGGGRQGLDGLRAEMQRKLAAQIDLGTPPPPPTTHAAPEVERVAPPRAERRPVEAMRAEVRRTATVKVERPSRFSLPRGFRMMRPSRLLLVGVAIIAGGLAAFLMTQREQAPAPVAVAAPVVAPVPVAHAEVLVAKQAIGIGQKLTPAMLTWQDWPQDAVRPEYITVGATPDAVAQFTGSVARSDFIVGEPIRKEKLADANQGFLASVLGDGMRGVSVAVAAQSASGGFVSPNDHVDVVVTRTANSQTVSDTILRDVRVLAINDQVGAAQTPAPPGGAAADPATARGFAGQAIATLELNPTQAEVIINAANVGKLTLVLRSLGDVAGADDSKDRAANEAIRLSSPFWAAGGSSAMQPR